MVSRRMVSLVEFGFLITDKLMQARAFRNRAATLLAAREHIITTALITSKDRSFYYSRAHLVLFERYSSLRENGQAAYETGSSALRASPSCRAASSQPHAAPATHARPHRAAISPGPLRQARPPRSTSACTLSAQRNNRRRVTRTSR